MLTPHWIRRVKSPSRSKRRRSHARRIAQAHGAIRWHVEYLEERTLLAVIVSGGAGLDSRGSLSDND
jgi:Uri superfamily endonuclease